jgi:hypothetical protein
MSNRIFTNKERVEFFFTENNENLGNYFCICGKERKQKVGTGYQNLIEHITRSHSDWKELMLETEKGSKSKLASFIDTKSSNIYSWIDWIVAENLPFNFCEKECTRKYVRLKSISVESVMKYMELLVIEVEERIKKDLPDKFALVFDGWSEDSTHFIGIFAVYFDKVKGGNMRHLLAFTPLLDETDLSANSQSALIVDTLELYGRNISNLVCIIGDNCSTNKSVADKLGVPVVGCASHRFNLAVNSYLEDFESLLEKVSHISRKLRTIKNSAQLRKKTSLRPVLRNATRWSSAYLMLQRFLALKEFIDPMNTELAALMPTAEELISLQLLSKEMLKFQSVTMQLQKDGITMHEVRVLFDAIIEEHPNLSHHLSSNADIVHSPHFESGLVKVTRDGDNCNLSRLEKLALERLKIDRAINPSPQKDMSFAERALKRFRVQERLYQDISFICPTSNIVERLFSTAKLVFSDLRRSLLPRNLEMLLFLKLNRDLWDLGLVGKVVNKK